MITHILTYFGLVRKRKIPGVGMVCMVPTAMLLFMCVLLSVPMNKVIVIILSR